MIHSVKCLTDYFNDVLSGRKGFEVRKNDRDYRVGDFLALNEFDGSSYTGRCAMVYVDYLLANEFCKEGFVIMGIKPCSVAVHNKFAPEDPLRFHGSYEVPLCTEVDK